MVKEIEKAILASDLGITPNNDGKNVILNFPELTEERRKELAKDIKKKGEEAIRKWIKEKQQSTYIRINPDWRNCDFQYDGWVK